MEDLIKFYLLQKPRNVSDIIEDLTYKSLSDSSDERRKEIPKIAGNWFRKDTGYIWRLKHTGDIKSVGRKYSLDIDNLIDDLIKDMEIEKCFPEFKYKGGKAKLEPPYVRVIGDMSLNDLKERIRNAIFTGERMSNLFNYSSWKNLFTEEFDDKRRVFKRRISSDFKSLIHFIIISSVFKSRKNLVKKKIESGKSYFRWKNRLDRLKENEKLLNKKIFNNLFPELRINSGHGFEEERVKRLFEAFGNKGYDFNEEVLSVIADMYLLYFKDGVELFKQYSKYDHDIHLFFNLLERGWMVDSESIEKDTRTGNFIVPLNKVGSYLDDLSRLFVKSD